jgi:hypothetical protein
MTLIMRDSHQTKTSQMPFLGLQLPAASIGHNNPPEPIDSPPLSEAIRHQLQINIGEIRVEIKSPEPNTQAIEERAQLFYRVARKLAQWLEKGFDKIAGATVGAGLTAAYNHYPTIIHHLGAVRRR